MEIESMRNTANIIETPEKSEKRKRDKEESMAASIKNMVQTIKSRMIALEELAQKTGNIRTDIRKEIRAIRSRTENLNLIVENFQFSPEKHKQKRLTENVQKVSIGTQTDEETIKNEIEEERKRRIENIKNKIEQENTFKEFEKVLEERWPEDLYKATEFTTENIEISKRKKDIAIIMDPRKDNRGLEFNVLEEKIPEMKVLTEDEMEEGTVESITIFTEIVSSRNKNEEKCKRVIYTLPIRAEKDFFKTEDIYNIAQKLKERIETDKDTEVVVTSTTIKDSTIIRKCMEKVFHNTKCKIYILGGEPEIEQKQETGKLIVKANGRSYAELVKDMKKNINIEQSGITIKGMKRTVKGDLFLEVVGKAETNKLKKEIVERTDNKDVIFKTAGVTLEITEVEAGLRCEQVESEIARNTGIRKEEIKVQALREIKRSGNQVRDPISATAQGEVKEGEESRLKEWLKQDITVRRSSIPRTPDKLKDRQGQHSEGETFSTPVGVLTQKNAGTSTTDSELQSNVVEIPDTSLKEGKAKEEQDWTAQKAKRKRKEEDSPTMGKQTPNKEDKWEEEIGKTLEKLVRQNRNLNELVSKNANTKRELKTAIGNLGYLISRIETQYNTRQTERKKAVGIEIGTQTEPIELSTMDKGTQANEEEMELEEAIDKARDYQDMEMLLDRYWPEEAFKKTREEVEYPIKADKGWDLAIVMDPKNKETGIGRILKERHPDAWEVIGTDQRKLKTMKLYTKAITYHGKVEENEKHISVMEVEEVEGKVENEQIYNLLTELGNMMDKENRKKIIIAVAEGLNRKTCRKMIECVFRLTDVEIIYRVPAREQDAVNIANRGAQRETSSSILIKSTGSSYADLLRRVKEKVDIEQLGIKVKRIKQVGEEDVHITVEGGKDKAERLKGKINQHCKDITITTRMSGTTILILGMGADTEEQDITEALVKTIVEDRNRMYVTPFRINPDGTVDKRKLIEVSRKLRQLVDEEQDGELKVIAMGDAPLDYLRKGLELGFNKSKLEIKIITKRKEETIKANRRTDDKLILKAEGRSYADMLKDMKKQVDVEKLGVNINRIKKTASGDLLLQMKGGRSAEVLKRALKENMTNTVVIHKKDTKTIQVLDITADLDKEEIIEAIQRQTCLGESCSKQETSND
ncbi:unnamed protein product [Phyllotreta striolata]|uniref:Uncharacterized protein n=1 Tax=Phyllotreta striolata TaxID=444603 RepID=A0A9N9T8Z2_PHYSR|nr:unnamed protein product [Phyllotreta striolata]